jgi:hypothetical protein
MQGWRANEIAGTRSFAEQKSFWVHLRGVASVFARSRPTICGVRAQRSRQDAMEAFKAAVEAGKKNKGLMAHYGT